MDAGAKSGAWCPRWLSEATDLDLDLSTLPAERRVRPYRVIGFAGIRTGVGGLDWNDVAPVIERHLGALEIPVYVDVEYIPGAKAAMT